MNHLETPFFISFNVICFFLEICCFRDSRISTSLSKFLITIVIILILVTLPVRVILRVFLSKWVLFYKALMTVYYVIFSCAVYPTFDVRPKNTTAFVNDNLWLYCNATGDPKPKISWGRYEWDGDRLDEGRFILHRNGTLHIKRVRLEDQGWYYCIAGNHAEMKLTKFRLVVKSKLTRF